MSRAPAPDRDDTAVCSCGRRWTGAGARRGFARGCAGCRDGMIRDVSRALRYGEFVRLIGPPERGDIGDVSLVIV